jgi:hypothetical protein
VVAKDAIEAADYNLSPSRFVRNAGAAVGGDIQTLLNDLSCLRKQSCDLDADLNQIFTKLGFEWEAAK